MVNAASGNSPLENQEPQRAPARDGSATIVDKTPAELVQAMPELAGLEPAKSQEVLPEILKNVGAKVEDYFHNVVSTSAQEETIQERLGLDGKVEETYKQAFRYLVIAHPEKGPLVFEEYRTDEKSRTASGPLLRDTLLTEDFVYIPVYLHPVYQEESDFSYVGQQRVEGHKCHVVAFAQVPRAAHLWARLTDWFASYKFLLQGLVWIDPASFQIIRMYTELLPDATVGNIKEYTTDVTYGEVRFKGIDVAFWLPREVVVNLDLGGRKGKFRNYHRYSHYQLYTSQTKLIY
jgi:hypothetical protein